VSGTLRPCGWTVTDSRCSSHGAARVPSVPHESTYDIAYYHRDPRNLQERMAKVGIEDLNLIRASGMKDKSQFELAHTAEAHASGDTRLMHPNLVDTTSMDDAFYEGNPGRKDPDVNRYSPDGLRSAMTTSWAATDRALRKIVPDHLERYKWESSQKEAEACIEEAVRRSKEIGAEYPVTPMISAGRTRMRQTAGVDWRYYDRIV
jgi:hypothetical protein